MLRVTDLEGKQVVDIGCAAGSPRPPAVRRACARRPCGGLWGRHPRYG
ncbi:MAG: hypothetical protein M3Q71_12995 [Chloroflexota bacterium]|nr:hypothetical protein [Chloroflexota bacterium]